MASMFVYYAKGEEQTANVDATGDADTSRDYPHTHWASVDAFATGFATFVAEHHGTVERVVGTEAE